MHLSAILRYLCHGRNNPPPEHYILESLDKQHIAARTVVLLTFLSTSGVVRTLWRLRSFTPSAKALHTESGLCSQPAGGEIADSFVLRGRQFGPHMKGKQAQIGFTWLFLILPFQKQAWSLSHEVEKDTLVWCLVFQMY